MKASIREKLCVIMALTMLMSLFAGCGGGAGRDSAVYSSAPAASAAEPAAPNATEGVPSASEAPAAAAEDHTTTDEESLYGYRYEDEAPPPSGEEYDDSAESPFLDPLTTPLSTFSSDVDTASYSNMRRFINDGMRPEGTRIEELVNYFDYDYPRPDRADPDPFSITTQVAACPWNTEHQLAMIGIQGADLPRTSAIASNIVLLLDVSGSMDEPNKLPLLRESFLMLLDSLDKNDIVSIVTYAGSDRVLADSLAGDDKRKLKNVINRLSAGGSTAGAAGIRTAYQLAEKNFIEGGNNRIILATDGDFNVGESGPEALTALIQQERDKGIFISVLGFGMSNLKDSTMESIADNGNGNYAYIDSLDEARKVLVDEFDSTMFTIAKDLKLQVEFNPAVVGQYRLVGYNNRRMADEDFADDTKDAGDIGSGHSVTAFYELIPVGSDELTAADSTLKYQQQRPTGSTDYMTVKVRYKRPDQDESKLVESVVPAAAFTATPSQDFGFASAVAEFGLILTDSEYRSTASLSALMDRAGKNLGEDPYNLRAEFCDLVETYKSRIID